jgi:hypothetical protein
MDSQGKPLMQSGLRLVRVPGWRCRRRPEQHASSSARAAAGAVRGFSGVLCRLGPSLVNVRSVPPQVKSRRNAWSALDIVRILAGRGMSLLRAPQPRVRPAACRNPFGVAAIRTPLGQEKRFTRHGRRLPTAPVDYSGRAWRPPVLLHPLGANFLSGTPTSVRITCGTCKSGDSCIRIKPRKANRASRFRILP